MINRFSKIFSIAIALLCSLCFSSQAMSVLKSDNQIIYSEPELKIDSTNKKQGEFFVVEVTNAKYKPHIWFNTVGYESFPISDTHFRALIPVENLTKPGSYSILVRSGAWEKKVPVSISDNGKGISYITLDSSKSGLSATQKELRSISSAFRSKSKDKLWSGKFIYPSKASKSSPFGVKRSYNKAPVSSYHKGLDFAGSMGSPVYAPADAKVIVEGYEKDGFQVHGNTLVLDHGHAVTSIYMHLSKIDVKDGDLVKKGQKIGEVGHTGISTGPHLHWGVYLYGTSVEPEIFVKEEII